MDRVDEAVKLNLRLDEDMHQRFTTVAKQSVRSLQGEIIWRLRQSLEQAAGARAGDERR
jgi:predicted HicB family RNase H-like nuclease